MLIAVIPGSAHLGRLGSAFRNLPFLGCLDGSVSEVSSSWFSLGHDLWIMKIYPQVSLWSSWSVLEISSLSAPSLPRPLAYTLSLRKERKKERKPPFLCASVSRVCVWCSAENSLGILDIIWLLLKFVIWHRLLVCLIP